MGIEIVKKTKQTNEERRAQAVQAIIASARAHFALSGFAGASMSVIAKNADVNPSLIYHYYENKEELWRAVKDDAFKSDTSLDFTTEEENEGLHDFLERVLTKRFEFYKANPELLRIINWEQLQEGSNLYGAKDFKLPWKTEIARLIESGETRLDLDPDLAITLMISALRSIFTDIPNLYGKDAAQKQKEYLQFTIKSLYRAFRSSK